MATKIYLGQTVRGTINLRTYDKVNDVYNPYVIQTGAVIQLNFPGAGINGLQGTSVQLSSTGGEITVVNPSASQITYTMAPAKSVLLFITTKAAVDCIITNLDGSIDIFEAVSVYNILAKANP